MSYALSQAHYDLTNNSLSIEGDEVVEYILQEQLRERHSICCIASENVTTRQIWEAQSSICNNKYAEGYPGSRYYGSCQFVDKIETVCQQRALKAFSVEPEQWGVNVQALAGSVANFEVYSALLKPHERIMGLYLPDGGHLSHGYQTEQRPISATAKYFESMPYRVDPETQLIDYDTLAKNVILYRPKILVAGTSAYCRLIDYKKMREIADSVGAYLMVDMAHIAGLVAAGVIPSPFEYADIVTTTTHKSLRGPRGAMIFFKRGVRSYKKNGDAVYYDLENPINFSVFPGSQGGPFQSTIAALAVALKQVDSEEFKQYQQLVLKNAKALEDTFKKYNYKLVTNGTDTHMVLVSLREKGTDGARVEYVCEKANITLNKNSIPHDSSKSAIVPGGIRIGAPSMTTRGMGVEDFTKIAEYVNKAVEFAVALQKSLPKEANKLKDFKNKVDEGHVELEDMKKEIFDWAGSFPLPTTQFWADLEKQYVAKQ